jgi:dihydroxyacetone kinase-like protein
VTALLETIGRAAEAVRAGADELNRLDGQAGDGDLGVTMAKAATVLEGLIPDLEGKPAVEVLRTCGAALAKQVPSTSGTLVATAFLRAARAAGEEGEDADLLARALRAAQVGIQDRGKAEPGSKTMLDALAPAVAAAETAAAGGESVAGTLRAAADAAEQGAQATKGMQARHGRAGWLAERSAGHEDGGARLVAIVLEAAARSTAEA